jgi:hypothetical protein
MLPCTHDAQALSVLLESHGKETLVVLPERCCESHALEEGSFQW